MAVNQVVESKAAKKARLAQQAKNRRTAKKLVTMTAGDLSTVIRDAAHTAAGMAEEAVADIRPEVKVSLPEAVLEKIAQAAQRGAGAGATFAVNEAFGETHKAKLHLRVATYVYDKNGVQVSSNVTELAEGDCLLLIVDKGQINSKIEK